MEPATREKPTKRVRINPETEVLGNNKTPTTIANKCVSDHVVSLLPAMKSLLQHYWKKFFKFQQQCHQISNKLNKMDNETFVPKSAAINFTLGGSTIVKESAEFTKLAEDTTTLIDKFKKSIGENVSKAAKLEYETVKQEVRLVFCDACNKFAHAIILQSTSTDTVNDIDIHNLVYTSILSTPTCLSEVYMTSVEFQTLYKKQFPEHQPVTLPQVSQQQVVRRITRQTSTTATTATTSRHFRSASSQQLSDLSEAEDNSVAPEDPERNSTPVISAPISNCQLLSRSLTAIFVKPWNAYVTEIDKRLKDNKLKRFVVEITETQATDDAAARLDKERTIDAKTIEQLIDEKVNKRTKSLTNEINQLKQQLVRSKNSTRGGTPNRASSKKKQKTDKKETKSTPKKKASNTKSKGKPTSNKKKKQQSQKQADGNEQDTANAKGNKKKQSSKKKKNSGGKKKSK
jgi:hypothetical protein